MFKDEGINVVAGVRYPNVAVEEEQVVLAMEQYGRTRQLVVEGLLLATGRSANVEHLSLDAAGVGLNGNGGIKIDDRMRTSGAGIYAAGDVTGQDQFVYMAAYGGRIAASNALNGNSLVYDARRYVLRPSGGHRRLDGTGGKGTGYRCQNFRPAP